MKARDSALINALAALFGLSSWIAVNGLWVETPILVSRLPESWKLASYLTVITQLANIGTITYSLLRKCISKKKLEVPAMHIQFAIGTLALVFMLFFWQKVSVVGDTQHSVAFMILSFFLAMVDCTSSVLYIPFMSNIPSKFLVSHLVGQALSGLVPSIIALIQGVGGNPECVNINGTIQQVYPDPRFSVDAFLVFLIFLVCVSWVAFILLSNLKRFFKIDVYYEDFQEDLEHSHHNQYSKSFVVVLLIMEAVICSLTNGILTSIQPYSVLYYGNLTYHFVVTLGAISSPVGCILTSIPMKKERLPLFVSVFVGLCASLYILLSALASPNPLITFSFGSFLIVLTWIVNNMSFSYARALISKMFRSQNDSHRLLFVGGIFTQIGSAIGAFLMFYLVNYVNLFKSYEPCKQ